MKKGPDAYRLSLTPRAPQGGWKNAAQFVNGVAGLIRRTREVVQESLDRLPPIVAIAYGESWREEGKKEASMELREEALIDRLLSEVAQEQIRRSFRPEYRAHATEEQGLGIALAHHFQWSGTPILQAFHAALEDANYHSEAQIVSHWIERESENEC